MPRKREPTLPKQWPQDITYLTAPQQSPALTQAHVAALRRPKSSFCTSSSPPSAAAHPSPSPSSPPATIVPAPSLGRSALVRIQRIADPQHPAHAQHGLFAAADLAPSRFVLPYLGRVHTAAAQDTDAASDYDVALDRALGLGVDAARAGNEARFVNDYRGVPAGEHGPNVEFADVWVEVVGGGGGAGCERVVEKCVGVFVLSRGKSCKGRRARGIRKGEELLVSYGKGFWNERRREGDGLECAEARE